MRAEEDSLRLVYFLRFLLHLQVSNVLLKKSKHKCMLNSFVSTHLSTVCQTSNVFTTPFQRSFNVHTTAFSRCVLVGCGNIVLKTIDC